MIAESSRESQLEPSPKNQTGTPRRRRWRRWALHALLLTAVFLAGAYAKWQHWDWIAVGKLKSAVAAATNAPELISEHFAKVAAEEQLPVVLVDIKPKHIRKLKEQGETALRDGFLRQTDEDFVPGQLTHDGRVTPVRIRLKGGRTAHWSTDKWSFRVKVKGDDRPFGMRTMSFQHPMTRFYLNEWGFLENLRREGILAVRYQFVRLVINGEDKGIYALEEHFSKELLEAHGRREGVIVAFDDSGEWRGDEVSRRWVWWNNETDLRGWRWSDWDIATRMSAWQVQDLRSFDTHRVKRDGILSAQRDEAFEALRAFQEGRRPADQVFDARKLARYTAIVDLWRAWHAVLWQNSRFYFNPVTARLEPIGFDAMPLWGDSDAVLIPGQLDDRTISGPLRDPAVARLYLEELERISDPTYLEQLRKELEPRFEQLQLALKREFESDPKCRTGSDLTPPWGQLAQRQQYIRETIHTDNMVLASATRDRTAGFEHPVFAVDLRNTTVLPIEIVGFRINSGPLIHASRVWVGGRQIGVWENPDHSVAMVPSGLDEMRYREDELHSLVLASFRVPIAPSGPRSESGKTPDIEVALRFPGQGDYRWAKVPKRPPRSEQGPVPPPPSTEEVLGSHPFLERTDDNAFRVPPGDWNVEGDLVLPAGASLDIAAGATLRFEPTAVLYSTGPLHLTGTAAEPIVLDSQSGKWGGVAVSESPVESTWEHAVVRHTSGVHRGGWLLTGGVTFYKSAVSLAHVDFTDSLCEDALNVIHARSDIRQCTFSRCASDAFDGDYITGVIEDCRFADIGGDALDFSGSTVRTDRIIAERVSDKAVSVGEKSHVTITSLTASDVGIGVAGKDESVVQISGAAISRARLGLTAYQKKAVFGPASLTARDVVFDGCAQTTVVQTGSELLLDGVPQAARPVEVADLVAARSDTAP